MSDEAKCPQCNGTGHRLCTLCEGPPCRDGHDWRPSGMFLMKQISTERGTDVVGGLQGYWGHRTPEVERCDRCWLLRMPPEPVRVSREPVPIGEKAGTP